MENKNFINALNDWDKVIADTYAENNKYMFQINLGIGPIGPISCKNIDDYEQYFTEMSYEDLNSLLEWFTEQFDEYSLKITPKIEEEYGSEVPEEISEIYQSILNVYDMLFADEDLIEECYGYSDVYFPAEFFGLLKEFLDIKLNGQCLFSLY